MYRPNFSKSVLMSYILDIEEELNKFSSDSAIDYILEIIKTLKEYIREG
jgi:hypothetical protein